jgi:hypothetical protein
MIERMWTRDRRHYGRCILFGICPLRNVVNLETLEIDGAVRLALFVPLPTKVHTVTLRTALHEGSLRWLCFSLMEERLFTPQQANIPGVGFDWRTDSGVVEGD